MIRTEPITVTLLEEDDGSVILEGRRTSVRVSLGQAALFADYTRPQRVIDQRGSSQTVHRVPDVGVTAGVLTVIGTLLSLRRRRSSQ